MRFFIRYCDSELREFPPKKTPANFGLDASFPVTHALRQS
jgi:hypothetical protein